MKERKGATTAAVFHLLMCPKLSWHHMVLKFLYSNTVAANVKTCHYNLTCQIFCLGEKSNVYLQPRSPDEGWYNNLVSESDAKILTHSGKMVLLFEILRIAEDLGDKVYVSLSSAGTLFSQQCIGTLFKSFCFLRLVFSQSLISLDLIEDFLRISHNARDDSSFKGIILLVGETIRINLQLIF